ncbi:A24 family peptidase [Vibrio sinaloensis]|uniref:A24 family peptidase n=1 Tax=Photobacterium sp. (strain ATCC 43367) TaxID=379097 RepID=UPI0035EDCA0D
MEYFIWFVLLMIAVSDAREHRIPNVLLILTLVLCVAKMLVQPTLSPSFTEALMGGGAMFFGALVLHLLRVMAPGDVKLLGVVGFWLGWGHLMDISLWIAVASILVGSVYALIKAAGKEESVKHQLERYKMLFAYGRTATKDVAEEQAQKLRMPFAPIVVIGLALQSYF